MNALLENLQTPGVSRDVKIAVLGCFGDIALAIGGSFEPYLETSMMVLGQAGEVSPNPVSWRLKATLFHGSSWNFVAGL